MLLLFRDRREAVDSVFGGTDIYPYCHADEKAQVVPRDIWERYPGTLIVSAGERWIVVGYVPNHELDLSEIDGLEGFRSQLVSLANKTVTDPIVQEWLEDAN